jgi:hypothetical protein
MQTRRDMASSRSWLERLPVVRECSERALPAVPRRIRQLDEEEEVCTIFMATIQ